MVYEVLEGDGEPMRTGRVLSAEFVNANKAFQAMWFQPPGQDAQGVAFKGGYYTLDGQSLRRAFLSSPVEFSRVSSGFSMRFHPILQNGERTWVLTLRLVPVRQRAPSETAWWSLLVHKTATET